VSAESARNAIASISSALEAREVRLFDTKFHAITLAQACNIIYGWIHSTDGVCRVVVTPNVDHVVRMKTNETMDAAYRSANLVVADGWPLVAVSRFLRPPLPERVAGSDLVPSLIARWVGPRPLRVFLLGAAP
jgi:N-acetylglucosaminyldiphosphoundecaprenol N-acetyl-beta-D-mannosaminyltransferase